MPAWLDSRRLPGKLTADTPHSAARVRTRRPLDTFPPRPETPPLQKIVAGALVMQLFAVVVLAVTLFAWDYLSEEDAGGFYSY